MFRTVKARIRHNFALLFKIWTNLPLSIISNTHSKQIVRVQNLLAPVADSKICFRAIFGVTTPQIYHRNASFRRNITGETPAVMTAQQKQPFSRDTQFGPENFHLTRMIDGRARCKTRELRNQDKRVISALKTGGFRYFSEPLEMVGIWWINPPFLYYLDIEWVEFIHFKKRNKQFFYTVDKYWPQYLLYVVFLSTKNKGQQKKFQEIVRNLLTDFHVLFKADFKNAIHIFLPRKVCYKKRIFLDIMMKFETFFQINNQ